MNDDLDNLFKELDDVNNGKFSASGFLSSLATSKITILI